MSDAPQPSDTPRADQWAERFAEASTYNEWNALATDLRAALAEAERNFNARGPALYERTMDAVLARAEQAEAALAEAERKAAAFRKRAEDHYNRAGQAERERDEARRLWDQHGKNDLLARAEQAERQAREMREGIKALAAEPDIGSPSWFADLRALSGVSGPATGRAHSLSDCWCGERHRREDFL